MVQGVAAQIQPALTQNQRLINAQTEMFRGVGAQLVAHTAAARGIAQEHTAAVGRMDTTLAAFSDAVQNMSGQIARTGATTGDLIGALAHHLGQQQSGRDTALLQALQQIAAQPSVVDNRQVHMADARQVNVDARQVGIDQRQVNVDSRTLGLAQVNLQDNRVQLNTICCNSSS